MKAQIIEGLVGNKVSTELTDCLAHLGKSGRLSGM